MSTPTFGGGQGGGRAGACVLSCADAGVRSRADAGVGLRADAGRLLVRDCSGALLNLLGHCRSGLPSTRHTSCAPRPAACRATALALHWPPHPLCVGDGQPRVAVRCGPCGQTARRRRARPCRPCSRPPRPACRAVPCSCALRWRTGGRGADLRPERWAACALRLKLHRTVQDGHTGPELREQLVLVGCSWRLRFALMRSARHHGDRAPAEGLKQPGPGSAAAVRRHHHVLRAEHRGVAAIDGMPVQHPQAPLQRRKFVRHFRW